jgi:pantoate--beta-alanine ligase
MTTLKTIAELKKFLSPQRQKGGSVGFVPTMGALHAGHISLIERAKSENSTVVCSIFVNPTQFNDPKDLAKYPHTPEKDSRMLEEAGCDVLFLPDVLEMYPNGQAPVRTLDLGNLDRVMEGKHRHGHFQGVIQVVSRLFDIVEPNRSYFGQKDFQQLALIREMTRQLNYPTEIIGCPIIREPDELAMSSRNVLLSPEERILAAGISRTLFKIKELCNKQPVETLLSTALSAIASIPGMSCEYFEIADARTLESVSDLADSESVVACIAVKLGSVRLIDNILLK